MGHFYIKIIYIYMEKELYFIILILIISIMIFYIYKNIFNYTENFDFLVKLRKKIIV